MWRPLPPTPWEYFGRKFPVMKGLGHGLVRKIFIPDDLRAKYYKQTGCARFSSTNKKAPVDGPGLFFDFYIQYTKSDITNTPSGCC